MKKIDFFPYFFSLWVLVMASGSVLAEYRADITFATPEAGFDKEGNPLRLPDRQADETDFRACRAITDNINAMEKYHVQWECDFPISANNYFLSKPQWVEITGEEKRRALATVSSNRKNKSEDGVLLFGFPYNVDAVEGDEKIYISPYSGYECKSGSTDSRIMFWFSENNDLSLINHDVVLFASRLYFIDFIRSGYRSKEEFRSVPPKTFFITTLRTQEPYTGLKVLGRVCSIKK